MRDVGAEARRDWLGTLHPPAGDAPRIACLVPSLTETLFALGLADRVVARTGFCTRPRGAVRAVAKVGGTKDPDLAKLAALAPTHLVVNVDENRREDVEAAAAFVPHVIVTHPAGPQDNGRLLRLLGAIFGRERAALAIADDVAAALAALDAAGAALPREAVVYVIWRSPWMCVSRDTYIAATLARAGWDTLPARSDARYPALDDEAPAWREATRILLATEPYAFRERDAQALSGALRKPVHLIDGEWTSWYGARAREGLRALAQFRTRVGS